MSDDYMVTVCAKCLRASCWHGEALCDGAAFADVVKRRASELRGVGVEHPSHYSREKILRVCGSVEVALQESLADIVACQSCGKRGECRCSRPIESDFDEALKTIRAMRLELTETRRRRDILAAELAELRADIVDAQYNSEQRDRKKLAMALRDVARRWSYEHQNSHEAQVVNDWLRAEADRIEAPKARKVGE